MCGVRGAFWWRFEEIVVLDLAWCAGLVDAKCLGQCKVPTYLNPWDGTGVTDVSGLSRTGSTSGCTSTPAMLYPLDSTIYY